MEQDHALAEKTLGSVFFRDRQEGDLLKAEENRGSTKMAFERPQEEIDAENGLAILARHLQHSTGRVAWDAESDDICGVPVLQEVRPANALERARNSLSPAINGHLGTTGYSSRRRRTHGGADRGIARPFASSATARSSRIQRTAAYWDPA